MSRILRATARRLRRLADNGRESACNTTGRMLSVAPLTLVRAVDIGDIRRQELIASAAHHRQARSTADVPGHGATRVARSTRFTPGWPPANCDAKRHNRPPRPGPDCFHKELRARSLLGGRAKITIDPADGRSTPISVGAFDVGHLVAQQSGSVLLEVDERVRVGATTRGP